VKSMTTHGAARVGRPTKGLGHVDRASGSAHAKRRLKTVLMLLAGEVTRDEAATRLDVSVRRLRELRDTVLGAAVASLEPGIPGRPRKERASAADLELLRLEAEADLLAWELDVSRTREELALLMPQVVSDRGGARGKTRASRKSRSGGAAGRRTKRG